MPHCVKITDLSDDIMSIVSKYSCEKVRNKKKFRKVLWDLKMLTYSNDYYIRSWSPRDYFDWCYEEENLDENGEAELCYAHIRDCCRFLHQYRKHSGRAWWCKKYNDDWKHINQSIKDI